MTIAGAGAALVDQGLAQASPLLAPTEELAIADRWHWMP